ncbi:MAG: sugar phosphate isomerase/epimerase family protein [Chloroflexota bacterium]
MSATELPVVGAAMPISALRDHADWLIEDQRDLEIQDACLPGTLDTDWSALTQEAGRLLEGHHGRRGIHAPFDGITIMAKDKRARQLAVDRLCQAIDFGSAVGASHMVVHSPFKFFGTPFVPHSRAFEQDDQIELIHKTLDPILPAARDAGMLLVIEGIEDKQPGPLLAAIRSFNSDRVRMSLDIGHAMITNRVGGPPPDQWVREAGDLLGHLHLQDSDGNIDRHWAPGRGQQNWYALFEALASLSHQPRLIIEVKDKSQIRTGAAWLAAQGYVR